MYGDLTLMTHDHIIPRKLGSGHEPENIQTLCYSCNQLKGASLISIEVLRERLQKKRAKAHKNNGKPN